MTTAEKTASHYVVMAEAGVHGFVTVDVSESLQEAVEYRDLHDLTDAEIWVIYTDAGTDRVA